MWFMSVTVLQKSLLNISTAAQYSPSAYVCKTGKKIRMEKEKGDKHTKLLKLIFVLIAECFLGHHTSWCIWGH